MGPLRLYDSRTPRCRRRPTTLQGLSRDPPALGAVPDARYVGEAHLLEELRRPEGAIPVGANGDDGHRLVEFVQPGRQVGLGQVDRPRNMALVVLLRFANVEDNSLRLKA